MQVKRIIFGEATIMFSTQELELLCHAVRETRAGLHEQEFETRTSETPEYADQILAQLVDMFEKANEASAFKGDHEAH